LFNTINENYALLALTLPLLNMIVYLAPFISLPVLAYSPFIDLEVVLRLAHGVSVEDPIFDNLRVNTLHEVHGSSLSPWRSGEFHRHTKTKASMVGLWRFQISGEIRGAYSQRFQQSVLRRTTVR
jgi:hypothetical protein